MKAGQGVRSSIVGRGAAGNPKNRFEKIEVEPEPRGSDADEPGPETVYLRDASRSIIAQNDSPDLGFDISINPYRGCRWVHLLLRSSGTRVPGALSRPGFREQDPGKKDAPELLRKQLSSPRWKPKVLSASGVTDCYQPIEKKPRLTCRCLEILVEFRNPVAIFTKNYLATRDMDLFSKLARHQAAVVTISLTTLDDDLRRVIKPRTSRPVRRLAAIQALARASIPVGVMIAPVIPGLNDHELPGLLSAAAEAGASFAAYTPVRLPHAVRPLFEDWLARHFPDRKEKVLNRIRSMRGGKLNDARFGSRMRGEGIFADQISQLFELSRRRAGLEGRRFPRLSTAAFLGPGEMQPSLFD